jgi:hypothetical protein
MAIDGLKIIDSDLAHDVYNEFMDLYDAKVDIDTIRQKIETWRSEVVGDVEFEIFITSYGLALWETGNLLENIFLEIEAAIEKGAMAKMFLEEADVKASDGRQKELKRLWTKLGSPKKNPRKRKSYKKITDFLIPVDSIVAFRLPDKTFGAAIILNIDQHRGYCKYNFALLPYLALEKPTELVIKNGKIFIVRIGCGSTDAETVKAMHPGIERVWAGNEELGIPFFMGLPIIVTEHSALTHFSHELQVIGTVQIANNFKALGSMTYANTFEALVELTKAVHTDVDTFRFKLIDLQNIIPLS